jgi:hypothetical protein
MGISKEELDEAYGRCLIADSEIPPITKYNHARWQKAMQTSNHAWSAYNRLKAVYEAEERQREERERAIRIRRLVEAVTGRKPH